VNLAAFVATFLVVLAVELPDKTLMATLVLAGRYRAVPVVVGAAAAFFVQCLIAVVAGQVIALLPRPAVLGVVAVLFGIGAVLLIRESLDHGDESDGDQARQPPATGFRRVTLISFGVLFAAEWGDSSQLATAAMVARYDALVSVFLASWLALVGVAVLAATAGQLILKHVPVRWVQRVAGLLFGVFALVALYQLVTAL
jgi:putative Ca2+/H+ antiporter (TMEM165/GDT1 family)